MQVDKVCYEVKDILTDKNEEKPTRAWCRRIYRQARQNLNMIDLCCMTAEVIRTRRVYACKHRVQQVIRVFHRLYYMNENHIF